MSHAQLRRVAFIGTGIMGAPIARHILDAGFDLVVHNRTRSKADLLVAAGAHWADSVREAASGADVVFTMLGFPSDVEEVYLSGEGLIRHARKGAWLIDLSTSSAQLARDIHGAAEVMDKHAFDCPVTGGEAGAKAGTLTAMAGVGESDLEGLRELISCFADKIYCLGAAGLGQTAKLCNQLSLASCMLGYADALALGEQSGLDQSQLLDIISSGMGSSAALTQLAPKSVLGDYRPGFMAEHLRKDLALALTQAEDMDLALPGAETAFNLYDVLCQIGGASLGTQAISLLYADEASASAAGLDWSLLDAADEGEHDHAHDHDHHHHHDR